MARPPSFLRIPYVQRCRLVVGEQVQLGFVCNISVLGVYVTTESTPAVGQEVQVSFLLPGDETPMEGEAVVTWQNLESPDRLDALPPGCGLRFTALAPQDHDRIGALIEAHAEPATLPRQPRSGFTRVPYVRRCRVLAGGQVLEGTVCNISVLGVYVALEPLIEIRERVRISLPVPGRTTPIEAEAVVTWQNPEGAVGVDRLPSGCGFRFLLLPPQDHEYIQALIDESMKSWG